MKNMPAILAVALCVGSAMGAVTVKTEQVNPADPLWSFKVVPRPSRSDLASVARVSVAGNQLHAEGGPVTALVDGRLPGDPLELADETFFTNGNADPGRFLFDLGSLQSIVAVNSYSWHEYDLDQGARGPQVYTLYGSAADAPDVADLATWTKLADVDSRPNQTGAKWGGQHGVSITDDAGKLGDFRHLLFVVQPTRSPLQPDARVTHTLFDEIDVHTAATLAKAGDAVVAGQQVKDIIVVCKTHFDIGYTHRVKDLMSYYRTTMIDKAMNIMDASASLPAEQQFVWTSPGWVMQRVLEDWPGQTPERRQRLEKACRSGKVVTHALPFSIEAELLEPEEFARGYAFADTVARTYGLPLARGAKTTDVPSQSPALATGLAHGGVKFMHIGCNWPSGFIHDMPPIFWWEGPDGSRVLTMYSSIYGTCTAFWPWGGHGDPNVGRNLLPPPAWPYKTWLALIVTGDNSGPPGADGVKAVFAEAAKKMPGARVRMGTMEEFADAILAETTNLPVVKGETPDTWIHGCMSDPGGMKIARTSGPLLPAAEVLNAQLRGWGVPVADPAAELARAHENYLLYTEHTWGGSASVNTYGDDFQKLPTNKFAGLEGSWEDKTDYIRTAGAVTHTLLTSNLAALARAVKQDGPRIVVYNPLPWARSGIVEVAGRTLAVSNVPASGYLTLSASVLPSTSSAVAGDTIENEFLAIRLDPARGTIASLIDKRSGREWVDSAAAPGLGQYLNERFDKAMTDGYCRDYQQGRWGGTLHPGMHKPGLPANVPYRAASPARSSLRVTRDGPAQIAVLDLPGDATNHLPAAALRVTLVDGQPYLDLELTILDKARDNWPEADWLCLPFKLDDPQFRVGRTLGLMDPARDILTGANRHLYAVGPGLTLTDRAGEGMAICPLDHPLVSLGAPGMWKFSLDYVPTKPVVYLNLYNNQWNTNYRYWYPGTWSSRVRLWTIAKHDGFAVRALEARHPLQAAAAEGTGGSLPATQDGLSVSRPGVLVTALSPTLLRVWEQAGTAGPLTVSGLRATSATPVNLRGEPAGDAIPVVDGRLRFSLGAYAPATFRLSP